jgi:hypothetical protein
MKNETGSTNDDAGHWFLKLAISAQSGILAAATGLMQVLTNLGMEKGDFSAVNWQLVAITTGLTFIIHTGKPLFAFMNDELKRLTSKS